MVEIEIKYIDGEIDKIEIIPQGDWIDLRAAKTVSLKKGDFFLMPLGVAMKLPDGYEGWLTSRSSLCKNFGVFHCDDMGIIDAKYCGDDDQWYLPIFAVRDTTINKNDRICQFRIHKTMQEETGGVKLVEKEVLGYKSRGGIGSTGKN